MTEEEITLVREHASHIEVVCSDLQIKLDEMNQAKEKIDSELAPLGAAHKLLTESLPEA